MSGTTVDRMIATALALAAMLMAGAVAYREVKPSPALGLAPERQPVLFDNWRDLLIVARPLSRSKASGHPIELIEFLDLECPACRLFHQSTLPTIKEGAGGDLEVSIIHLPLSIHRFAVQAASAAECAAAQGRFSPFVELVLRKQDSIGLKAWTEFAREAGVPSPRAFGRCIGVGRAPRVDSGIAVAARLGINSTPTIVANGWRVPMQARLSCKGSSGRCGRVRRRSLMRSVWTSAHLFRNSQE